MKLFSSESKISLSLLGLVLVVSVLEVFITLYNALTQAGGSITLWPIVFTLVALASAVGILWRFLSLSGRNQAKDLELNSLKDTIRQSEQEVQEKLSREKESKEAVEQTIDIEMEAQEIMPTDAKLTAEKLAEAFLSNAAQKQDVVQGVVFKKDKKSKEFTFLAGYAFYTQDIPTVFVEGDSLPGQVAKNKETLNLDKVPEDYIKIVSGLGEGSPKHLLIIPVLTSKKECIATIELASFKPFLPDNVKVLERAAQLLSEKLSTTTANTTQE